MAEPIVSVIMPFLNMETYLDESIRSVVQQTEGRWELLLIDDGSTDASVAIARAWAERDPRRIRLLGHPERGAHGASAARNRGIAAARGDYLALLDADDIWLPTKLAEQIPVLEAHPEAGMLYSNTLYWVSWTGDREDLDRDRLPELGVPANTMLPVPLLLELCLRGTAAVPCTCSVLLRTGVARAVGGFEEQFRYIYTDQVFFAKMFLHAPVFVTGHVLDWYRLHPESSCSTAERRGELRSGQLAFFRWLAEYLLERGLEGTSVWNVLQGELRWLRAPPFAQRVRRFVNKRKRTINSRFGVLVDAGTA